MNEDLIKIQQLQVLAELKLNTDLARLKEISGEESGPRAVLSAIAQEKQRYRGQSQLEVTQSTRFGMDGKWQAWADRETRNAMGELARIAQRREDQMIIAKQAFGRVEALKSMALKVKP